MTDVVSAVLLAHERTEKSFEVYNVATGDYITVNEIAQLAIAVTGLSPDHVHLEHTGGDRGWKGDVPVVRLNTDRIQKLGWKCRMTSRQAHCTAMRSMLDDARAGRLEPHA